MGLLRTVRDCVYGMAVGDALGVPYEFMPCGSFTCNGMTGHLQNAVQATKYRMQIKKATRLSGLAFTMVETRGIEPLTS